MGVNPTLAETLNLLVLVPKMTGSLDLATLIRRGWQSLTWCMQATVISSKPTSSTMLMTLVGQGKEGESLCGSVWTHIDIDRYLNGALLVHDILGC